MSASNGEEENNSAAGVFTAGCVGSLGEAVGVGPAVCAPTITTVHAAITIRRAQKPMKVPPTLLVYTPFQCGQLRALTANADRPDAYYEEPDPLERRALIRKKVSVCWPPECLLRFFVSPQKNGD